MLLFLMLLLTYTHDNCIAQSWLEQPICTITLPSPKTIGCAVGVLCASYMLHQKVKRVERALRKTRSMHTAKNIYDHFKALIEKEDGTHADIETVKNKLKNNAYFAPTKEAIDTLNKVIPIQYEAVVKKSFPKTPILDPALARNSTTIFGSEGMINLRQHSNQWLAERCAYNATQDAMKRFVYLQGLIEHDIQLNATNLTIRIFKPHNQQNADDKKCQEQKYYADIFSLNYNKSTSEYEWSYVRDTKLQEDSYNIQAYASWPFGVEECSYKNYEAIWRLQELSFPHADEHPSLSTRIARFLEKWWIIWKL